MIKSFNINFLQVHQYPSHSKFREKYSKGWVVFQKKNVLDFILKIVYGTYF